MKKKATRQQRSKRFEDETTKHTYYEGGADTGKHGHAGTPGSSPVTEVRTGKSQQRNHTFVRSKTLANPYKRKMDTTVPNDTGETLETIKKRKKKPDEKVELVYYKHVESNELLKNDEDK